MSHPDVEKDYYSILGAGETASPDEIERLYKRLAKRHHPDRGGSAIALFITDTPLVRISDKGEARSY